MGEMLLSTATIFQTITKDPIESVSIYYQPRLGQLATIPVTLQYKFNSYNSEDAIYSLNLY